jgi:hypothetical protein
MKLFDILGQPITARISIWVVVPVGRIVLDIIYIYLNVEAARGSIAFKALRYKPESRWFEIRKSK